ncbi:hypothetical protein BXZ70DRAFT_944003 [Cristinia sonorae]|uniref:DUF6593 domain-containing protein n=1 Tax=Cristinia sonorae TaxID=1940300 RepID=A0A8K0UKR4_9AGAR|nr:hypothetical protein BXZ70DRAFT_944003 [Cristinia sonorae]
MTSRSRANSTAETLSPPPAYSESNVDATLDAVAHADTSRLACISSEQFGSGVQRQPTPSAGVSVLASGSAGLVMSWSPSAANGGSPHPDQPTYASASIPRNPPVITCTFDQISSHAMILVPPSSMMDTRPLYYISFKEDFFLPGNLITTIRRGGSENGKFVGEFNLKGGQNGASVRMGSGPERWLAEVWNQQSHTYSKWKYDDQSPLLLWERKTIVKSCHLYDKNTESICRFAVPNYALRNSAVQVAKLELKTVAQDPDICDHIILSALLMERQRLLFKD